MNNGQMLNDRYQLINVIGHGGMADVYLSWDHILKRYAAIKILRLDLQNDVQAQKRFQHEAAAIAELNSPYIVKVYDFGEEDNLQYLVMEYVKGTNLKRYLNQYYPLTNQRVVVIMTQIIKAVMSAHQNNIIHRDLKPQNVLIDQNGNVKISDFGISITMSDQTITKTNYVVGSIHYLSPEQISGRRATKQSDIYSLGIIMFELLTNHVPFDGDNAVVIALKHTKEHLPDISKYNHNVTQGLINVVTKATAKQPQERYVSVKEMLLDLQKYGMSDNVIPYHQNDYNDVDETKVVNLSGLNGQTTVKNDQSVAPKHSRHPYWRRKLSLILVLFFIIFMVSYYFVNQTKVPNLNSLSYQSAVRKLKDKNIRINSVIHQNDGLIAKNHVISTAPLNNQLVNRIWGVRLVLSTGHGKVKLGNYVGQNINTVKQRLTQRGFQVSVSTASSDYFKKGQILKQNFLPGKKLDSKKKKLHFTVSGGLQQFIMKNLVGLDKQQAVNYINQMGLNPTYEYRYSDSAKNNVVIQQNPNDGLKVYSGDNVIIVLANNNSNKQTNQDHNVDVSVNIPYVDNGSGMNQIEIYLADKNHSIDHVYRQMQIYRSTKINLPLQVDKQYVGRYQVYRDGKKIMDVGNIQ